MLESLYKCTQSERDGDISNRDTSDVTLRVEDADRIRDSTAEVKLDDCRLYVNATYYTNDT